MKGSWLSIYFVAHLLLTSSNVYTAHLPRLKKDTKHANKSQWPPGNGCAIVDGLVCGENIKFFCERETGICVECEDFYCNDKKSNPKACEEKCPEYYRRSNFFKIFTSKPTGISHSIVSFLTGSLENKYQTTPQGSLPPFQNIQTHNQSKSSIANTNIEENTFQVDMPNIKSGYSNSPISSKGLIVILFFITVIISAVLICLGFVLNKQFGLRRRITLYCGQRCDHLPIPATNCDDRDSQIELGEKIDNEQYPVIGHPTDDNICSIPDEHTILHSELIMKSDNLEQVMDNGTINEGTAVVDNGHGDAPKLNCSATARCMDETSKGEPYPVQNT